MQSRGASVAMAESDEGAQSSDGNRTERSNATGMRLLCMKMRLTLLFIGIINFVFGVSLRLTFISDAEQTSFDEKLWQSMRMAGSLLIGVGCITVCSAIVLIGFALKQHKDRTPPMEQSSSSTPAETQCESNVAPNNESVQRRSLFRGIIERIRKNWKKQAEWIHAQPVQAPRFQYVRRQTPIEFRDSPPNYVDILAVSRSISDVPPPPYDVVI